MYQEIRSDEVKCRKSHACEWCGELINVGEKAFSRAYMWEGDFHSDYMHPECVQGMRKSDREEMMDGFKPGNQLRGDVIHSREAKAWNEQYGREA